MTKLLKTVLIKLDNIDISTISKRVVLTVLTMSIPTALLLFAYLTMSQYITLTPVGFFKPWLQIPATILVWFITKDLFVDSDEV